MFNTTSITSFAELNQELQSKEYPYRITDIERAYNFAAQRHVGHLRKSGEETIIHLLTVAAYMVRLSLDSTSVISALLHETLELEVAELDELDKQFGTDVAFIVDGLTSLKKQTSIFDSHNENPNSFRKLMLNSTEDIRILLIRLANKLHNIQSWQYLTEERRLNQANKILLVYAPLCEYLGLGQFLEIFEDAAFKALNPESHDTITNFTQDLLSKNKAGIEKLKQEINEQLTKAGVKVHSISTRTKNPMSAYRKITKKYLAPEEKLSNSHVAKLKDLIGMRVVVDSIPECYLCLGLIHSSYDFDQDEFDDYIVKPKESGYKSIHTVINHAGVDVEVQIRTQEMHEYNETGPASHIAYKLGKAELGADTTWTKDLVLWQDDKKEKEQRYKVKLFSDSIFVFTPKGEVIRLDKGSTPIDYAFRIHSDIGVHYQGALVNGTMRPIDHELKTGDIVEIITKGRESVSWGWLKCAKMTATQSKIRKILRAKSTKIG